MSNFRITGALTFAQAIDENSTTQEAPLGTVVTANDIATTGYGMGEL